LPKLHKDGQFSDTAIRQVERDMGIDELILNQLLSKRRSIRKIIRIFKKVCHHTRAIRSPPIQARIIVAPVNLINNI